MSNNKYVSSSSSSSGINFLGLLTIVFVVAKITGYIEWSWLWVFAPIWIPLVILLGIFLIAGIFALIAWLIRR